ncbi:MAG: hypothetical protein AAB893_03905, partial [Patescibacteria group bacterium]
TFIMNVSVTETNFANVTFVVANASNGSQIVNTSTLFATSRLFMNYTMAADGNYTINVTVTDTANNRNMTTNLFVTVDTTAPGMGATVTPTSILPGETVTLFCSAVDSIDSSVAPSHSIKKPGASSFSGASAGSYTSTTTEGTYTLRCSSTDYTGNAGTADASFTVGAGGSGASGSGGGSRRGDGSRRMSLAPVAEEVVEEISFDSSEAWEIEGEVQYVAVASGEVYSFSFVSLESGLEEEHSISIGSVDEENGTVTIIVESNPQEIVLAIGESKEIDLDGDAVNDLFVTLNGITNGLADVTFAKLGDWIEQEVEVTQSLEADEEEGSSMWIVWTIVALVVVALLVIFLIKGKKSVGPVSSLKVRKK